jgi:hypothetical protein
MIALSFCIGCSTSSKYRAGPNEITLLQLQVKDLNEKLAAANEELYKYKHKEVNDIKKPFIHDIEIINSETGGKDFKVGLGGKIKLKAIPHAYDSNGIDVGPKTENFNPKWTSDLGIVIPSTGTEITYVAPFSDASADGGGWRIDSKITVSQESSEGKVITSAVRIVFKK